MKSDNYHAVRPEESTAEALRGEALRLDRAKLFAWRKIVIKGAFNGSVADYRCRLEEFPETNGSLRAGHELLWLKATFPDLLKQGTFIN